MRKGRPARVWGMDDLGAPQLTGYRFAEHVPGYTGHLPKMQNTFATTFATGTRVAMSCPPAPDVETAQIDFTKGRRRLQTAAPLSGTGFLGFVSEPEDQKESDGREKLYWQGTSVNLPEYYMDRTKWVERMRKENAQALNQIKNPIRNASQIRLGDYYYYAGKHMYDTTLAESFEEPAVTQEKNERRASLSDRLSPTGIGKAGLDQTTSSWSRVSSGAGVQPGWRKLDETGRAKLRLEGASLLRSKHTILSQLPEPNEDEPIMYRYKVAQALVGKPQIDRLFTQIRDLVTAKSMTAPKDMMRLFDMYSMSGKGLGHAVIGFEEFRCIGQRLGVFMTVKEALGLFGHLDQMSAEPNGFLGYFELIDLILGQTVVTADSHHAESDEEEDGN